MPKYTDDELLSITQKEIERATSGEMQEVSASREKAMYYYMGEAKGDLVAHNIEGSSKVVSTDVADTIEWMLPSLMNIFTAGEDAVEFAPQNENDVDAAKQATAYVNYIFYRKNPGWLTLYTWFKDALLQKTGFLKVYWDKQAEAYEESYNGLDEAAIGLLLEEGGELVHVEPVNEVVGGAVNENGQPIPVTLYNVVVRTVKDTSQVRVENVPPEEFLISPKAKTIADAPFIAHRVERTLTELREAGYSNIEDISDDDLDIFDNERTERFEDFFGSEDTAERKVRLTECYLKLDYDGTGYAKWRKIVRAGNAILENIEVDEPPFVSICPIPLPHKFFGLSVADQAMEVQRIKTSLLRTNLEGLYRTINERTYAVTSQVNMDDLVTNRPGGVVRVTSPGAVGPLQTGKPDLGMGMSMLEHMEVMRENRTGWTRYSQGTQSDSLNKTATGVNIITNKSEMRVQLIARVFAETGVKDLFRMILKLVSMYQDRQSVIRLTNKWVNIDPREWKNQFDFVINVGLGTGNKDQVAAQLMQIVNLQQQALQLGLADKQNLYNAGAKLVENLGFKNPEMFFKDPSTQQAEAEQQQDPEVMKAQAEIDLKMQEFELKRWQIEQEMALKRENLIAQINLKRAELATKMTPEAEQKLYPLYNQQSEEYLNDTAADFRAGTQPAQGSFQGEPSEGFTEQPPDAGSIQPDGTGLPQGMAQ